MLSNTLDHIHVPKLPRISSRKEIGMLTITTALAVSLLVSSAPLASQDTPLWRYTTAEKIQFYHLTPLGDVVVGTKEKVVALESSASFGYACGLRPDDREIPVGNGSPWMLPSICPREPRGVGS